MINVQSFLNRSGLVVIALNEFAAAIGANDRVAQLGHVERALASHANASAGESCKQFLIGNFNAMIYLTKQELYPLQLFLRNILTIGDSINLEEAEENIEELQNLIGLSNLMRYAVIVVASVPVMLIYPFVQRFFVKGVVVGSIKG